MHESKYTKQLETLYNAYPGKDLEAALGVTIRSMQNYLKKENPTTPGKDVINKIREVYAKHERGQPIREELDTGKKSSLEQSILFLTQDKLRSTAIMEKLADDKIKSTEIIQSLVSIIKDRGLLDPNLPMPGSSTTETLKGGKKD
jgi:transcriptional regulator with XRE-family HTH domain